MSNLTHFPIIIQKGLMVILLKGIVSGGDTLKIRGNYEDQSDFINKSTLFMLSNDMPVITPCDDAITLRCKCLKYNISFVEKPCEVFQRLSDPNVKHKFSIDMYKDALVHLMIRTYNNLTESEKCIGGYIEEPYCVLLESRSRVVSEKDTFLSFIQDKYEITNNESDYVNSRDIINYIKNDCGMNLSDTQIGRFLNDILKFPVKKTTHIRYRVGIKLICSE